MTLAILDTDMMSELLRGRNDKVLARARAYRHEHGRLTIAVTTVVELIHGYQAVDREDRVRQLEAEFNMMEVIPLQTPAAIIAGRIMGDLRRTGQPIGNFDPLIAAITIIHNRTLVTGNTRHYRRIIDLGYDLKLDDWREETSPS